MCWLSKLVCLSVNTRFLIHPNTTLMVNWTLKIIYQFVIFDQFVISDSMYFLVSFAVSWCAFLFGGVSAWGGVGEGG